MSSNDWEKRLLALIARFARSRLSGRVVLKLIALSIGTQMITQLLERVSDVTTAQTNIAKRGILHVCVSVLMAGAALVVLLLAIITIAAAIFVALCRVLPVEASCAVVGVILLVIAGVLALVAQRVSSGQCCKHRDR